MFIIEKDCRYKNKIWLNEQYIILNKSTAQIGIECNVSLQTIYYWLKKFNIEIRSKSESMKGKKRSEESKKKQIETNKRKKNNAMKEFL